MISKKNMHVPFKLLVLSALLAPIASQAMSDLRKRMFGPSAPQAPAGLIEQAREARIATQKAERELDREIQVTGSASIGTSNRVHRARDAQQWLDLEVARQTAKAKQRALVDARVQANMQNFSPNRTYAERREADRIYRGWRATGPLLAIDAPEYTAQQQAGRARDIEIMRLEEVAAKEPEIEKAYYDPVASKHRSQLSENYLSALQNYNNYGSWMPKWWRKSRLDSAQEKYQEARNERSRLNEELLEARDAKDKLQELKRARLEDQQRAFLRNKIESGEKLNLTEQDVWERLQAKEQKEKPVR